jgi:electron transfer flavoprotein alpha subunit
MNIVVFIEQRNNQIKRTALEALSKAASLASGGKVFAVLIGGSVKDKAEGLSKYGATKVYVFENAALTNYAPNAYAKLITKIAKEDAAPLVIMGGTAMGKDLAPRVAMRLGAGQLSDAVELTADAATVTGKRFAYSGKAIATVALTSEHKVVTVRPNTFAPNSTHTTAAEVAVSDYNPDAADIKSVVKEIAAAAEKLDVAEADIVVSGGRGLKDPNGEGKANWSNLESLAKTLGAAVGASRAVVDSGWRPHSEQVGQTGKVVSPKLYIAVGISGAVQHLAGMTASKVIVAINKDKDAPIFQIADYGIVGNAEDILPALTGEFQKVVAH